MSASYDLLSDKIVLTAKYTGELAISVEDVGGNFLEAASLLDAEQEYGANALFRVEGLSGGAQLSSASNTVKGIISNVTLTLKSVSDDPATITVSQNVDSASSAIKAFVDQYNSVMDLLATQTAYDKDKKIAGPLQGDGAVRTIQQTLCRLTTTAVDGLPRGLNLCWPSAYPQALRARATSDRRSSRWMTPGSRNSSPRTRRQWPGCLPMRKTASRSSSNHISAN